MPTEEHPLDRLDRLIKGSADKQTVLGKLVNRYEELAEDATAAGYSMKELTLAALECIEFDGR